MRGDELLDFIRCNGSFDATGHYPILAYFEGALDGDMEPRYVARARIGCVFEDYYTSVKEGASNATFILRSGESYTVTSFDVLVLRYNPIDYVSAPRRSFHGAMDSTGPLFWRNIHQGDNKKSLELFLMEEGQREHRRERKLQIFWNRGYSYYSPPISISDDESRLEILTNEDLEKEFWSSMGVDEEEEDDEWMNDLGFEESPSPSNPDDEFGSDYWSDEEII